MIETIRQGLKADGFDVSISTLCRWFGVPRRPVYYRPTKAEPKVQERFAEPIKAMIEENPSFGYRTVAHLLGFNKNTVQRVFQRQHTPGCAGCGSRATLRNAGAHGGPRSGPCRSALPTEPG